MFPPLGREDTYFFLSIHFVRPLQKFVCAIPLTFQIGLIWFLVFNTTFSNISAISWQPVLVVEEAEYPERTTDHGQAIGKLYHLQLQVECTLFCNLQSWARTHAILAFQIGFPKKDCMLTYYHMKIHSHMFEVVRKVEICFCSLR